MYALITGASSGMGRDMARILAKKGYALILAARNKKALEALAAELDTKVTVIPIDLSKKKNCIKLYHMLKDKPVDVVINNAGFGVFGELYGTDLKKEIDMINVNICAVHILTKLFLRKMLKENRGYILNVSSLAGFMPGPFMSSYYGSKSYVLNLTAAAAAEVKKKKKNVGVSVFCPGPVNTDFNNRAGVKFSIKPISSSFAAQKAIEGMFERKTVIFPRKRDRLYAVVSRIAPMWLVADVCCNIQKRKMK